MAQASPFFWLQEHLPPEVVPQDDPVQQASFAAGFALRTGLALAAGAASFCMTGHLPSLSIAQEPLVVIGQEPPLSMAQEPLVDMGQEPPASMGHDGRPQQLAFEALLVVLSLEPATCAIAAMARAALKVSAASIVGVRVFMVVVDEKD